MTLSPSPRRNGPRSDVRGPFLHQDPPPLEEIGPPVGGLNPIRSDMRQGQFADVAPRVRAFCRTYTTSRDTTPGIPGDAAQRKGRNLARAVNRPGGAAPAQRKRQSAPTPARSMRCSGIRMGRRTFSGLWTRVTTRTGLAPCHRILLFPSLHAGGAVPAFPPMQVMARRAVRLGADRAKSRTPFGRGNLLRIVAVQASGHLDTVAVGPGQGAATAVLPATALGTGGRKGHDRAFRCQAIRQHTGRICRVPGGGRAQGRAQATGEPPERPGRVGALQRSIARPTPSVGSFSSRSKGRYGSDRDFAQMSVPLVASARCRLQGASPARQDTAACQVPPISISNRQWSLGPHSSTPLRARTVTSSWSPRDAKA